MADIYVGDDWDDKEFDLFDNLMRGMPDDDLNDQHLQELFHEALFSGHAHLGQEYDDLKDYLEDEYGIDFARDFDWDGYREWYDSQ